MSKQQLNSDSVSVESTEPNRGINLFLTYFTRFSPEDGFSARDVRLFLKRLRKNFSRLGYPFFRYYCVVEYSPEGLAFYHLIIWFSKQDF